MGPFGPPECLVAAGSLAEIVSRVQVVSKREATLANRPAPTYPPHECSIFNGGSGSTEIREFARRGDSVLNGFLIGAGIGAVVEALAYADCDDAVEECLHPAAAAAIGGAFFGGVGALIDYFIKGRTVVFRVKSTALRVLPGVSIGQGRVRASLVFSTR
jgi:hypothetical protein